MKGSQADQFQKAINSLPRGREGYADEHAIDHVFKKFRGFIKASEKYGDGSFDPSRIHTMRDGSRIKIGNSYQRAFPIFANLLS